MKKVNYSDISKIVQENNVNKLREKMKGSKDDGREILKEFRYSLENEGLTLSASKFPRDNLHLLHVAAYYDSLECFIFIMNQGFNSDIKSPNDFSPIHYACGGGAIEVASFLCTPDLINRKDLNYAPNDSEFTPLYLATLSKSPQILQILFDSGATIPQTSLSNRTPTPLNQAVNSRNFECLNIILNHTNTQKVDEKNYPPLMKAISCLFPEAVKILVENGADICYTTPDNKNALYLACYNKNEELVRYLLENGADPTARGYLGQYPIHWAALSDNVNIVKLILAYGADPNVLDNLGRPPTFCAINSKNNKDQILKILLDAGCDPNAKIKTSGSTILNSLLVMDESPVILNSIKIVLEKGGDLNYVCKNKKTIYQLAKVLSKPGILKVFDDFIHDHPEIKVK